MNKIKYEAHFLCWKNCICIHGIIHYVAQFCVSESPNPTAIHRIQLIISTLFSTRTLFIHLFAFFSLSVFFHCSYFSCLALRLRLHCANVTNCQCVRFPFRGYAEALQQLCITLNIMHALFAFVQSIHSFHSSFHYFHFHIAHKSVHAHIVPYELLFFDLVNIFVFKSGPHNISTSFSFFSPSVFTAYCAWLSQFMN